MYKRLSTYQIHFVGDVSKHDLKLAVRLVFFGCCCCCRIIKSYRSANVQTHTNAVYIDDVLRVLGSLISKPTVGVLGYGIKARHFLNR
jgi:hypothetical protein